MRRPEVELPDEAAAFVEQHPDEIARLAGGRRPPVDYASLTPEQLEAGRARLRSRRHEIREYIDSPEGEASREAFLARFMPSAS